MFERNVKCESISIAFGLVKTSFNGEMTTSYFGYPRRIHAPYLGQAFPHWFPLEIKALCSQYHPFHYNL